MRKRAAIIISVLIAMLFIVSVNAEENETNNWMVGNYVDKFDRPTGEHYITTEYYIKGTFSNSATTDSDLKVQFGVDKEAVWINLYEYGDNLVQNYYSKNKYYTLYALDATGEEHSIGCYIDDKGKQLNVSNKEGFCRILEYGGEISFCIQENDGMSEYKFTVNLPDGFSDIYSEIGGEFQNNKDYKKNQEEEAAKHISGEIQITLNPQEGLNLECRLLSEIPDGTIIKLLLFKNNYVIDEVRQEIKNGAVSHIFENKLEGVETGDKFEVDAKIVYEEQPEEIQEKLGKGKWQEFYYLDGIKEDKYSKEVTATLGYVTYTVE